MELREDSKLKSSLDRALNRFSGVKPEETQRSENKSVYDSSLFVENNYASFERREEKIPSKTLPPNVDVDVIGDIEDLESLTYPEIPPPDPENFDVKVHYTGPMFDYGGYARMNRTFIFGLKDRGAMVKVDPMESITNVNKKTEDALRSMANEDVAKKYPKVFAMTVPSLLAHHGKKILYTMMETSNKVHKEYAEKLNLADEIWTPTTWCRDVFKNSGVHPPVYVMPLGVDTNRFRPGLAPLQYKQDLRSFRFLSVSGWSYRKGFDVLIRAYLEEFSNKDDVSLVISSRFAGGLTPKCRQRIMDDFRCFRSMVKKPDGQLPHLVLHSAYTPDDKMPNLYNSAHCYVLMSRGEGWGLPYCEAAACGVPVIGSDHGGQRDFLKEDNSYLVPPSGYFVSRREDSSHKNMAWISHFYENQEFPDFEGESFDLLKSHMRRVFENYGEAECKAQKLRQKMVDEFDWSHSVDKVYNRLKEVCNKIDGKDQ